jgi:K+-sensing histidine kinase KdpD
MTWVRARRPMWGLVAAFCFPLGVAGLLVPFRATFTDAAAALVLAAAVAVVAVVGTRVEGYVAALSACLWFDFFLTRPYEQLVINRRPDIEIAISLLVVGVVLTELAARSRHHRHAADEESHFIGLIHEVSEMVTTGLTTEEVLARVRDELVSLLGLRDCRFEAGTEARGMFSLEHDGQVLVSGRHWAVDQLGLPGRQLELVVYGQGRIVGRFLLKPTPGHPVSLERRVVAVVIADQVGNRLVAEMRSA